jgi:large subunit ribosomal protein L13
MSTFSARPHDISHEWFIVDATSEILGRLAAKIAHILRGKHKSIYTPHMDTGDFVIVTNIDKIVVTGKKTLQKIYYRHTGYPGGIYSRSFNQMLEKCPEKILINAVKGMLPKGPLGYAMLKKLKVYAGNSHPHAAQQPQQLKI